MIASNRMKVQVFYLFLLLIAIGVTRTLTALEIGTALKCVAGFAIVVISILRIEAALYFLVFSMLLSPEIHVASAAGRDVVLRLDDILLVIIGLSWLARTALFKELGLIRKTPINHALFLYAAVCAFSTLLGVFFGRVRPLSGFFYVLKYLEYFVVYFLVVNYIRDERQIWNFIWAILITGVLISIYGMMQIPSGVRVSAPFEGANGEPNTLGGYLLLLISICAGFFLTARTQKKKALYLGLAAFFSIPFIYTLSRSSWIALLPMLGTLLYFSRRKTILIYFTILAIALTPLLAPQSAKERFHYTFQKNKRLSVQVGGVTLDPSTSARLQSWKECLRDFVQHPLMGYGVTGYGFIDGQYFRTLVELGLTGLMTLFYLFFTIFREVLRVYRTSRSDDHKGLALGMLAGCMAMFVHAIGANTFIIVRIMEPFWFLVGLVIQASFLEKNAGGVAEGSKTAERILSLRSVE
jgi:O-antigen ligase